MGSNANGRLRKLLQARSIALVGASEGSIYAQNLISNLEASGFPGDLHLVNPKHGSLFGRPCYPSLTDIPDEVGVAYVLTPPGALGSILADCGRKGIAWAVVLSGGYKETGEAGARLETELAETARANGVTVLGPNTLGFLGVENRLAAFGGALASPLLLGRLAIVSHSGGMAVQIHRLAVQRGIGCSAVVAVGNAAMVSACDVIEHLIEDPATGVIAAVLESLEPVGQFVSAALGSAELGKPLVVLKLGRSELGARVATAHTGALAGHDRVVGAALRQLGALRVSTFEELVEVGALLAARGWPSGRRTAVVTGSGGASALAADLVQGTRIALPDFAPETRQALDELLQGRATLQNPLDMTGFLPTPSAWIGAVEIVARDPSLDSIVVLAEPPGEPGPATDRRLQIGLQVRSVMERAGKYGVLAPPISGELAAESRPALVEHGLHYSNGLAHAVSALDKAIEYSEARARILSRPELRPAVAVPARSSWPGEAGSMLTEWAALELLETAGIKAPPCGLAASPAEAEAIAERLGYPVVLKVQSTDVAHKSEVGGVVTGIQNRSQVLEAFRDIRDRLHAALPKAHLEGMLVVRQVSPVVELLLGVHQDPQFGTVLTLAAGGVLAELVDDAAIRILPIDELDAAGMLAELRLSRLVTGYRGQAPGDRQALIAAVVAIADLAVARSGRLHELEINPLFVMPEGEGVLAGDALVRMG